MMLLNTLLTISANAAFIQKIPMMAICLAIAFGLIAFCIGAKKGIRRVSLFGVFWAAAAVAFFLVKMYTKGTAATDLKGLIYDTILAAGCVLGGLFVYKFCCWWRRPKVRYVKKKGDKHFKDENGVEYDSEKEDFDDYEKYASTKMAVKTGTGEPKFFGRVFGGLVCVLNVAIVLFLVVAAGMYAIMGMGWEKTACAVLFEKAWIVHLKTWTFNYAVDFVIVGILLKNANNGFGKGFIESLRVLFVKLGALVAFVAAFYLPFSPFATASGWAPLCAVTDRFMAIVEGLGVPAFAAPFTGRLVCGAILYALMLVALWLLNKVFVKLADAVDGISLFRVTDGVLSSAVYVVIGCVVCVAALGALYLCSYFAFYNFAPFLSGGYLANGFFTICEKTLPGLISTGQAIVKGFIAGLIP